MEIDNINIKEMTSEELVKCNGGEIITAFAIGIGVGIIAALIANRRDKRRAEQ